MQDYFDKLRGRLYPRHFHYSYYGVLMCYYKMIASSTKSDVLYRWDSKKATHEARDCAFESPHLACVYFVWLVWGKRSWVCIFAPHTHIFHVKIAWLVIWDECTCVGASQDFVNIFFAKHFGHYRDWSQYMTMYSWCTIYLWVLCPVHVQLMHYAIFLGAHELLVRPCNRPWVVLNHHILIKYFR
jgi:hypothetical protein